MTVKELIEKLKDLEQEKEICILYDGPDTMLYLDIIEITKERIHSAEFYLVKGAD